MQQATHPRLHVRDAHDAHTIFEAVRQGFLRPISRRLNELERATHVRSGAIFVWVESDDDAGLKRWTDGRVWGQSRMREPYLFYDEKVFDSQGSVIDPSNRSPTFRFVDGVARSTGPSSSALSHQDRNTNPHPGLVKQAYSAYVTLDPHTKPQKWHLTAYFTYLELSALPTIDRDPMLRRIIVPTGIYRSGKARSKDDDGVTVRHGSSSPSPPTHPPSHLERILPTLPSLHSTVGLISEAMSQNRSHGGRLTEDQRVIQMLNSRHIR